MRLRSRRLLSYVLLATYASISLLGEGLHSLMPEAGHQHHHGIYIADCASHDHGRRHADHDHDADGHCHPAEAALTVSGCDAGAHVCEVCAFLFQAISQPAEAAAPIDWQPLVVVAASRPQPVYSPTSLGPHAPRGPPLEA